MRTVRRVSPATAPAAGRNEEFWDLALDSLRCTKLSLRFQLIARNGVEKRFGLPEPAQVCSNGQLLEVICLITVFSGMFLSWCLGCWARGVSSRVIY